jgi:hypothetical protein
MASLVLKMSVSLDGFVAPVDRSTDWVAAEPSPTSSRRTPDLVVSPFFPPDGRRD